MQPHPSVAARRPIPFGSGPRCRRLDCCRFGVLLSLWAALAALSEAVEAEERPDASPAAAPIVRVALPDAYERSDDEAARARRAALELPPRLVPEPTGSASAALASARRERPPSPPDAASRAGEDTPGHAEARDGPPAAEQAAPRDAASATDDTSGPQSSRIADGASSDGPGAAPALHAAGPDRTPAGSDKGVPAVHAAAFASARDEMIGIEPEAEEPGVTAPAANGADPATRRDDGRAHEPHAETLSLVLSDFRPRTPKTHGGHEGRGGAMSRSGLARPSGPRAGVGSASTPGADPPRESSGARDDAARDWKFARGRWGLERGGRLSMDLESGYRLSLKPRRSGLVLSIRRNF